MEQLILHGIGDYFIQTDTWALNKKKKGSFGIWCCTIHCVTYSFPFILIGSWQAVIAIFISHWIIDRTKIIGYALAWKNGVKKTVSWNTKTCDFNREYDISNFGFGLDRPKIITVWLYIITDNLCHIICNYLALRYL